MRGNSCRRKAPVSAPCATSSSKPVIANLLIFYNLLSDNASFCTVNQVDLLRCCGSGDSARSASRSNLALGFASRCRLADSRQQFLDHVALGLRGGGGARQ